MRGPFLSFPKSHHAPWCIWWCSECGDPFYHFPNHITPRGVSGGVASAGTHSVISQITPRPVVYLVVLQVRGPFLSFPKSHHAPWCIWWCCECGDPFCHFPNHTTPRGVSGGVASAGTLSVIFQITPRPVVYLVV